jgi:hypothetical protein
LVLALRLEVDTHLDDRFVTAQKISNLVFVRQFFFSGASSGPAIELLWERPRNGLYTFAANRNVNAQILRIFDGLRECRRELVVKAPDCELYPLHVRVGAETFAALYCAATRFQGKSWSPYDLNPL